MDQPEMLSHGREELAGDALDRDGGRRRWRRLWLVGAVGIGILAASGLVGYRVGVDRVRTPHGAASGSVVVLPLPGGRPSGGGVAAGAVWVTIFGSDVQPDGSVVRVDPTNSEVVARIRVGRGPLAVADGFGSVWVSNGIDGTVTRIDPATNHVIATIAVGPVPYQMAQVAGWMWVSTQTSAVRLDPTTNAVDLRVKLPLPPNRVAPATPGLGLAADERGVWVSTAIGTVVRIRPDSGKVAAVIRVLPDQATSPGMAVIDGDHVWVTQYRIAGRSGMPTYGGRASVASISVASNHVDQRITTGGYPIDWLVPSHARMYMLGNDLNTNTGALFRSNWPYDVLDSMRVVGSRSFAIMIAAGHMWIPSWDEKALYRLPVDG